MIYVADRVVSGDNARAPGPLAVVLLHQFNQEHRDNQCWP
jgi:hypothetical protein